MHTFCFCNGLASCICYHGIYVYVDKEATRLTKRFSIFGMQVNLKILDTSCLWLMDFIFLCLNFQLMDASAHLCYVVKEYLSILKCGFWDSSVVLFMNVFHHIPIVDTWKHSIKEESWFSHLICKVSTLIPLALQKYVVSWFISYMLLFLMQP